jgi:L-ascorbate metabolism protein UlaG (beta-lactamase superfamily)
MNPREAVRIAVELGVQVLVPMHWDMFTPNLGFPEHVVQYAASEFPELTVLIFGRRQRFIYAPDKA